MRASIRTLILAMLPASGGIGLAVLLGDHWSPAIIAMLGGVAAAVIGYLDYRRTAPLNIPEPTLADRARLTPAALLNGIDDPMLLIEQGRVALANEAARALL